MSIGELVLDAGVEYFNLHLVNSMEETSVWVKVSYYYGETLMGQNILVKKSKIFRKTT